MKKFYLQKVFLFGKYFRMKLPVILFLLLSALETQAQQKLISGRVIDKQSNPLFGVSITINGSAFGAVTDSSGIYKINIPSGINKLTFTAVGYGSQEIEIGNQSVINVTMGADVAMLSDVVVVGYGTQKRSEVIGSIAQIAAKDINNRTAPQLQQVLTGQLSGVTVIQRSGQPGAPKGSIQIRGVSSFGAGTVPLILVDGIPVSSMNDIDPNDVENLSVLKDASSSAIYGSRAANGVILITTKSAKSERMNISYNAYFGFQKPTKYPEYVNSWEYATLINEASGGGAGGYTDAEIQKFKDGTDPDNYPNVNFIDEIFKKNSIQTKHNLTISNKTKNSEYLLSLGYLYQNGIIPENDYNRYNLRLNLASQLASNVELTTRLSSIHIIDHQTNGPSGIANNGATMAGLINETTRYPSIYPGLLSNGDFGLGAAGSGTPISTLASNGFFKNRTTDLNGNMRLDWNAFKILKFSFIGGYTQFNGRNDRFYATQRLNANVFLRPSSLAVNNVYTNYKTFQQVAEYNNAFGKHNVSFLAGHSYEAFYFESSRASRLDFPSNDITVIDAGSADGQTSGGSANESALDSYFGRIKYNYANKYFAEGVMRYDGSSRFPVNNRYALFPSAAIGWRISEEKFLKNKLNFLNELKLKASYGVIGNQDIGNYPYQETFTSNFNYGFGNRVNTGVANTVLVDPTIHWESTRTYDIGMEAGLFKGKLLFSATYYNRYSYDILVTPNASVSNVLGFNVGRTNSGSLENSGWEFTVDHHNKIGDFNYFLSANFSTVNNKVLNLGIANIIQPNGLVGNGSNQFIGYPLGLYYGYITDGLYVDATDVANYKLISNQSAVNPLPQPGDIKYKDISGPNGIPDGKVDPTYDRTIIGSTIPKYSYGLTLGGSYKRLSIRALIQAVSGVQGRLTGNLGQALYNGGNIQRWQMEERWTVQNPNPNAKYPRIEIVPNTGTANTVLSDFWVLNASYIKLRNIELGYSLPSSTVKRLGLSSLRFNLTAENLLTISGYRAGWDPETNGGGLDYYPILKNYTFGISANF